jgi:four helix bundle protein
VLNIVEGCSNVSNKVFFNHLQYSYGSAREVDVLLQLCLDLDYIKKDAYASLVNDLEQLKATTYQFMKRVDTEVLQKTDNYTFW